MAVHCWAAILIHVVLWSYLMAIVCLLHTANQQVVIVILLDGACQCADFFLHFG